MNKKFLSAILFGALMVTSTSTFVSCKDYDDDISSLQEQITANATAIATINKLVADGVVITGVESTETGVTINLSKGDPIKLTNGKDGAAGTAWTISEDGFWVKDGVKTDYKAIGEDGKPGDGSATAPYYKPNQETGNFDLVEGDKVTPTDISWKSSTTGITAIVDGTDLILSNVAGVDGGMITIPMVTSRRLTSMAFVPDQYIDGIPTIYFKTLEYTPQVFNASHFANKPTTLPVGGDVLVSNKETEASYRLNPTGVTAEDIMLPSYVYTTAENVTKAIDDKGVCPVGVVAGQTLAIDADGILNLKIEKLITTSLNPEPTTGGTTEDLDGKFYTVSLKAPIAKKNLVENEIEGEAAVYSEYVRIAERTIKPEIEKSVLSTGDAVVGVAQEAWVDLASTDQHYKDSTLLYTSAADQLISWNIPYNAQVDLNTLVEACQFDGNYGSLTHPELDANSYGLAFRFAVATGKYFQGDNNNTDQQEFATITDGVLKSRVYTIDGVSQTAVNRQPIIRIALVDTVNNNLVVQRYMKIKWTKEPVNPIELPSFEFVDSAYFCGTYNGRIFTQEMNESIYDKVKEGGMTKDEFHQIYTKVEKVSGTGSIMEIVDPVATTESNNLLWTLTHQEIGTIFPAVSKDFDIKIKYVDPTGLKGDVFITLKRTILMPNLGVFGHQLVYWKDNQYNLFKVNPIVYGNEEASNTCNIGTDLLNGFLDANTQYTDNEVEIISGFNDLQEATFEFDAEKLKNYTYHIGVNEYTVANGGLVLSADKDVLYFKVNGALIEAARIEKRFRNFNNAIGATDYIYSIDLDEAGTDFAPVGQSLPLNPAKALVGKSVPVKINVDLCGDNLNVATVKSYEVFFITPLKINAELAGKFVDATINGSRVSAAEAFTFTDWNNHVVAEISTVPYAQELFDYYEVGQAEWLVANATTNLSKDGSGNLVPTEGVTDGRLPHNVKVTYDAANDELVYWNEAGTPVNTENEYIIYIPVSVSHKWGTAIENVAIPVKAAAGTGE